MKVLCVEDDPIAQRLIESSIKSLGHEIVLAADGEAAWRALGDPTLHAVVCDWWIPGIDGLELCRRVRARGGAYIYFALITVQAATAENLDAAYAAGVDDFLTKPVKPRELKTRLHVAARILGFTAQVRQLESFLPICTYCKKIRDDKNYWEQIERYVEARTATRFSHGICPDCYERVTVPQLSKLGLPAGETSPPPVGTT